MVRKQKLLERLEEIGESLQMTGKVWALISLGSTGAARFRLDDYSDLDFFVIAKEGNKDAFISSLDWLSRVSPIGYSFRNTDEGYKVLFRDGIYCEFAVFETVEMGGITFADERIVWQDPDFDPGICLLQKSASQIETKSLEWLLGEILSNLYVGLCRNKRGEVLSAFRLIQVHAIDRLIEMAQYLETEQLGLRDRFSDVRRFEQRFPKTAMQLTTLIQGYEHNKKSAKAMLEFLDSHFSLNSTIKSEIMKLDR
jgi:lincosamide nucleotidyltransferase B/F